MEKFISNIQNIADGVETRSFRKVFTDEERGKFSLEVMDRQLERRRLKLEIGELNKQIKALDKESGISIDKYQAGAVEELKKAFFLDDQETGFRSYYDADGHLLEERRLRPDERQERLINHFKLAENE